MCGFAAFFEPERHFPQELLAEADKVLFHRGPDSGGFCSENGIGLVFRRLAIMDPTAEADQPMNDPSGLYTIVFNGEIYNQKELKRLIEGRGVTFRTRCDTEVILNGYIALGEKIFDLLEGMYALVIVDRKKQCALAIRDPFGIKPLYMHHKDRVTAFASEMRVLTMLVEPEVDPEALGELLVFGWAAGKRSNLKNIEKVQGGTLCRVDLRSGELTNRRFLDVAGLLSEKEEALPPGYPECIVEELEKSLSAHLMSDVGYALQLSGGIDSSLVAALTSLRTNWQIASFSVDLGDHPFNEKIYRTEIVDRYRLDHHEIQLGNKEYADVFEKAVWHMEGPLPHLGCAMIMLICDRIKAFSKVVLTGEGADEMFGGYERYATWPKLMKQERLARLLPAGLLPDVYPFRGIRRLAGVDSAVYSSVYRNFRLMEKIFPGLFPVEEYRESVSAGFDNFLHKIFAIDQSCYLESLLMRQDKMSMAHSVEARVPFVHLPLARTLNRIPRNLLAPGGETKPLLKKIAERYLPNSLLYRRKNGLRLPYQQWLGDENGLGRFITCIYEGNSKISQYGDQALVKKIVDDFRAGRRSEETGILMHLINIEVWLRCHARLALPL